MPARPTARMEMIEPKMARIPEGWFWMGCEAGRDDEKPVHHVLVDAFELGVYQVTNREYADFILPRAPLTRHGGQAGDLGGPNLAPMNYLQPPCWNDPNFNDPKMPVVAVSWHDAVNYCEWLSRASGKSYRLPTEAEWERAARGGAEKLLYPWGDAPPEQVPDYAERWKSGPESVGSYAPNAYGLHNLGDNVHEWCADWYDANYYGCSPERNPRGPASGTRRASRGGSWRHHVKVTRTAARSSIPPDLKYADYGFRVARSLIA